MTHNNVLLQFGGYDGTSWLNDMHEFNFGEGAPAWDWALVVAFRFRFCPIPAHSCPPARGGCAAHALDACPLLAFFWADTETWRVVLPTGTIPSKRSCPAWTKHEDSVFVFGGYDGLQRMNDFFEFRLGVLRSPWSPPGH
jgi:hypothetical protein